MEPQKLVAHIRRSGLSEKAALVYATLLEVGGAYPSYIASHTHLNRSTVYKILLDLSVKGLVTEIEKGKKLYYQLEKPEKLIRFAERQVTSASDAYEQVQKLYPELQGYFALLDKKPRVSYYEGVDGALSIYEDHVASKKPYEMLSFANTATILNFLPEKFYKKYRSRKAAIGITTRGILPDDGSSRDLASIYTDVPEKYRAVIRYVSKEDFPFEGEIVAYGENKVAITNLDARHISGTIIEDRSFHLMMRSIFNLAWAGAKEK